jgi:hypothetical protein
MLYPGGVGSPAARPILFHSRLCLASIFLSIRETQIRKFFKKTLVFLGTFGVSPVVAPEGGLALPRVKQSLPQCSCAFEPPRVRKVPKKINK